MRTPRALACVFAALLWPAAAFAQPSHGTVSYTVTFPEPEHRWMQVEMTIDGAPAPLELRMSRSSPGRYALHEFAKNVYDIRAFGEDGTPLAVTRPDPYGWTVPSHDGRVRVSYRVFGDRVDGTYLAVDSTHAHINMPAAFMWARGTETRPRRVKFVPPDGAGWRAATQLFPTDDPWTFTAPNLQYFMDSPTELGPVLFDTFTSRAGGTTATIRIALHHPHGEAGLAEYADGVRRIVREAGAVFGGFPQFEAGSYTFLADYLPRASGDGMEHRNSTVLTGGSNLTQERGRRAALGTVAHEFVHAWNVERIRPASLEPFDFERANMSGELWLAEGFTTYYGMLLMHRAAVTPLDETVAAFGSTIDQVVNAPGRQFRSPVEMSRMAPFVDAARSVDPTNFGITYLSYYTWGGAIGLALDLSLRDLTHGRVTLDDYMRAMWRAHGSAAGAPPGLVARPYTLSDARERLAEVSGDRRFAEAFFSRYIEGRDVADYEALLGRAGLVLKRSHPRRGWIGPVTFDSHAGGAKIADLVPPGSAAHQAGLEQDDVVVAIGGRRVASASEAAAAVASSRPGERVIVQFLRRGVPVSAPLVPAEDPTLTLVTVESAGGTPTPAQRAFRNAWLSPLAR